MITNYQIIDSRPVNSNPQAKHGRKIRNRVNGELMPRFFVRRGFQGGDFPEKAFVVERRTYSAFHSNEMIYHKQAEFDSLEQAYEAYPDAENLTETHE